jgi:RNA polymerase sigma factor (sigma-70 family)
VSQVREKTGLSERELYEAVHARMRTLAGPLVTDRDDLAQIAAEQVFRYLPRFEGRSEVSTWIYSICYRVLLGQRRWYRRWRLRFDYLADDDAVCDEPTPVELLEARARAREVHRLLARLSDKYRAVVVLHDLEQLKVSEIAKIVDCNELTVRSRLRDGRKHLATLLRSERSEPLGLPHELKPY